MFAYVGNGSDSKYSGFVFVLFINTPKKYKTLKEFRINPSRNVNVVKHS